MRPLNPYLFISSQKQRKSFDCIGRRYEYSKYVLLFFATFFNPSFLNKIFHIHSLLSFTLLYVVIQFESNNKNHFLQRGNSTQERATHEITFIAQTNIQLKKSYILYLPFQLEVSSYSQSAIKCYYRLYSFSSQIKSLNKRRKNAFQ